MKKGFKLLFAALFALASFVSAQADEITLFDGTDMSEYSPVYAYNNDVNGHITQTILPASYLESMVGATITSMKFYVANENGSTMTSGKLAISLGSTEMNSFYQTLITDGLTQVAEIELTEGQTEILVNFAEPWRYEGANIVIEAKVAEIGNYTHVNFYGQSASGASNVIYGQWTKYTTGFYPKTTFTYEVVDDLAAVSTNELDFSQLYLDEEATKTFTLKNIGKNAFTPVISALAAPFSITPAADEIAPGESVEFTVKFAPTAVGEFAQTLTIDCGAAGNFEIALTGVGAEMPAEVVVADGTSTNSYVPVYGYSFDGTGGLGQMIYPENMLTGLVGKKINALKFHHDLPYSKMNGGNIQLSMKVVEDGAFISATAITDMTVVANGSPVAGETEIVFTFNEPFLYNGGNLAVEALVTEAGSYGSEKFYGIALTGASYGYYNDFGWENRVYDFLPKATFGYVKEETPEPEVMRGDVNKDKAVNIADVTALIDMLLGGAEMIPEADCNLDNAINIADVTTLIDFLLNGTW